MLEAMRQRQLGSDGLVTSALGMGCMGLSQGYGPADDDESIRAIRRAAELGVTMFDTAMSYGQGHNERLIGQALAGLPWQVQRPEHLRRADPHPAAEHRAEFGQVATGRVNLGEHLAGPGQEQLTSVGQRHPAGGSLEQCRAEFGLKPPDLRGHGRLRDMQPLGGLGEAAVAHHCVEVGKLPQLHPSRMICDKCLRK